jgi:hypothetical protein
MRTMPSCRNIALCYFAAAACGSNSSSPAREAGDAAVVEGATADAGTGAGIAQVSIGPIDVAAGVEKTLCVTKRLGNAEDLVISGYGAALTPGSHHLIVYQSMATEENLTPTPCSPFVGLASSEVVPMVLVNKLKLSWTFPMGIGVEVPANQMVRIEAHYINTTAADLKGSGTVTLQGTPKSSAPPFTPASFLFWGTESIDIPPGSKYTAGPNFRAGTANTHLISIFTHQHELGTGIQVWASASPGDMSKRIADDPDWSNPSWTLLDPQVDFDGTSGLTYQCDWDNTTPWTIHFGESALDEMCFIGGYYYPAHGFDLEITGTPTAPGGAVDSGSD